MTKVFQKQTVSNQPVNSQTESEKGAVRSPGGVTRRVVTVVVGMLFMLCFSLGGVYALTPNDPYVQSVLHIDGNADRGHDIFQLNCATCHGLEASGEVGPGFAQCL